MTGARFRVAVMQPYLFPYVPYLQLMAAVDRFVILDTAQFIARGFAQRNVIERDGQPVPFTIPIAKAPRDAPFAARRLAPEADRAVRALRQTVTSAYARAPGRDDALACLDATFPAPVAGQDFTGTFERMADWLERALDRPLPRVRASALMPRGTASAQDHILDLVTALGGTHYLNPIGGQALYDPGAFAARGIELDFLASDWIGRPGGQLSLLHALARDGRAGLAAALDAWHPLGAA